MSYKDKLASVVDLINHHNSLVEAENAKINVLTFEKKLKELGGTSEEALQECTWEDLENCGLPRILARKAAQIFRAKTDSGTEYISPKSASKMTVEELIKAYKPTSRDNIYKELLDRSANKKFIVFNSDNTINFEKTIMLFNELQSGYPERDYISVDDKERKVYKVGEGKAEFFDESPLYPNRALRPDGTDDQLSRSWEGVPFIVRQLIYLAVTKTKEISQNKQTAHDILDIALSPDSEKKLRTRLQEASRILDELLEFGTAPRLKITIHQMSNLKSSDPFFAHKTF